MVTAAELASALGIGEDADATWTVLGKVTSVLPQKLVVKIGSSQTNIGVERYCDANVGDIVYIVVEDGVARAIACRGGQSAAVGQAYFGAIYSATPAHPELFLLQCTNPPGAFTEGMIIGAYCGSGNSYTGGAITIVMGLGGDGRQAKLFAHGAEVSSANPFTWNANDMLLLAYHESGIDPYLYVVSKYS